MREKHCLLTEKVWLIRQANMTFVSLSWARQKLVRTGFEISRQTIQTHKLVLSSLGEVAH
jgi:hypothetical protein